MFVPVHGKQGRHPHPPEKEFMTGDLGDVEEFLDHFIAQPEQLNEFTGDRCHSWH